MRLLVILFLCMSCADDHASQEANTQALLMDRAVELGDFSLHIADALIVGDWAELFSHYPPEFQKSCSVTDYSEIMDAYWNDLDLPSGQEFKIVAVRINESAGWVQMSLENDGEQLAIVGADKDGGDLPNFVWLGEWYYAMHPATATGTCDFESLLGAQ